MLVIGDKLVGGWIVREQTIIGADPNVVALCAKAHDRASDRPFAKASALLGISTHEYLVERYQAMIDNAHHHVAEFIAIKLVH